MRRDLNRLLRPKSIAVVGGREAAAVIEQCRKLGFGGEIWPVHPKKTEISGLKTYSSIEELPSPPDAAYVAVNRKNTIAVVDDLRRLGCGGVISYASGFLEADDEGALLQNELIDAAGEMPLVGPNCYGLINYRDGVALWPDQHGGRRLNKDERGVAIITQSSNIAINMTMQRRGLPIAYIMTVGNQAQTGLSDIALDMLDDAEVSALGIHVEGFDSIAGFEAIARKSRRLKKPVIVMKIGRSEEAKAATYTHTAAIAGSDAAGDAFLRRIGLARVASISSFLETLKLLHVTGPLDGFAISSMSCSGGEAGLMADACLGREIFFPKLTDEQKMPIQKALGPMVTIANPLDYHTYIWGDKVGIEATFGGMMDAGFDLNCLVLDFPRSDKCSDREWWLAVDAFEAAAKSRNVNSAVISTIAENLDEHHAAEMIQRGIAPLCGTTEAIEAIEAGALVGRYWKSDPSAPVLAASMVPDKVCEYDEVDAKILMAGCGIAVPKGTRATNLETAVKAALNIGFPVALKLSGITHKSEYGAVALGLQSGSEVEQAVRDMAIDGHEYYVEAMVDRPVFELLVGIMRDEQFGLTMTIATGGKMVEIFDDQQLLLLPVNRIMIEQALGKLKSAVFFDGFRGLKKADYSATIAAIEAIAEFAVENQNQLIEMEINPLIVCEEGYGAIAADALLKMGAENGDQ